MADETITFEYSPNLGSYTLRKGSDAWCNIEFRFPYTWGPVLDKTGDARREAVKVLMNTGMNSDAGDEDNIASRYPHYDDDALKAGILRDKDNMTDTKFDYRPEHVGVVNVYENHDKIYDSVPMATLTSLWTFRVMYIRPGSYRGKYDWIHKWASPIPGLINESKATQSVTFTAYTDGGRGYDFQDVLATAGFKKTGFKGEPLFAAALCEPYSDMGASGGGAYVLRPRRPLQASGNGTVRDAVLCWWVGGGSSTISVDGWKLTLMRDGYLLEIDRGAGGESAPGFFDVRFVLITDSAQYILRPVISEVGLVDMNRLALSQYTYHYPEGTTDYVFGKISDSSLSNTLNQNTESLSNWTR